MDRKQYEASIRDGALQLTEEQLQVVDALVWELIDQNEDEDEDK